MHMYVRHPLKGQCVMFVFVIKPLSFNAAHDFIVPKKITCHIVDTRKCIITMLLRSQPGHSPAGRARLFASILDKRCMCHVG